MLENLCHITFEGNRLNIVPADLIKATGVICEDLFFEYQDLEIPAQLPEHVMWVTAIMNLAPLVWALGLEVRVPFRCTSLEEGLGQAHAELSRLLPEIGWTGRLHFDGDQVEAQPRTSDACVAMFSGGLDSVHLAYMHLAERPTLVKLERYITDKRVMATIRERAREFARMHGLDLTIVVTNVHEFLNQDRLAFAPLRRLGISWWTGTQFGMSIAGAAAPVAAAKRAGKVYLASSYTREFDKPVGTSPEIEGKIRWPEAVIVHDAFAVSRQQKIIEILNFIEKDTPRPALVVCVRPTVDGPNCGKCEKCLRTMAGLIIEGENPRDWGFAHDRDEAGLTIKNAFAQKKVKVLDDQLFLWGELVDRASISDQCPAEFEAWITALDLRPHFKRTLRLQRTKSWGRKLLPRPMRKVLKAAISRT